MSHALRKPADLVGSARVIRSDQGFTLIEMLIVILIIGLVAGLVGPALFNRLAKSQESAAMAQMKGFSQALDIYRMDAGRYPDSLDALIHGSGQNWDGPYLRDAKEVPKDPWGKDYQYSVTDGGKDYTLRSQGADKELIYK